MIARLLLLVSSRLILLVCLVLFILQGIPLLIVVFFILLARMHPTHFFIAHLHFLIVLNFTYFLMDYQVRKADYPVPQQVLAVAIELLAQLVEAHRRRFAVEGAAVVSQILPSVLPL